MFCFHRTKETLTVGLGFVVLYMVFKPMSVTGPTPEASFTVPKGIVVLKSNYSAFINPCHEDAIWFKTSLSIELNRLYREMF